MKGGVRDIQKQADGRDSLINERDNIDTCFSFMFHWKESRPPNWASLLNRNYLCQNFKPTICPKKS